MSWAERAQQIVVDGNLLVALAVAALAGFVSFASPCVLPLVPGYLSYMSGVSGQDVELRGGPGGGHLLAGAQPEPGHPGRRAAGDPHGPVPGRGDPPPVPLPGVAGAGRPGPGRAGRRPAPGHGVRARLDALHRPDPWRRARPRGGGGRRGPPGGAAAVRLLDRARAAVPGRRPRLPAGPWPVPGPAGPLPLVRAGRGRDAGGHRAAAADRPLGQPADPAQDLVRVDQPAHLARSLPLAVEVRPPAAPSGRTPPRPGLGDTLRQAWREYRSMRTALVLLVVLDAASILGSLFPQEGLSPQRVDQYFLDHPALAPVLERLGLFDVSGSAWYMAIYLALLGALVACLVPRGRALYRVLRSRPPRGGDLARYRTRAGFDTQASPDQAMAVARRVLRRGRYRLAPHDPEGSGEPRGGAPVSRELAGEKGYLREASSMLFHLAL